MLASACASGSQPGASSPVRTDLHPVSPAPISSDWTEYHRDASRSGVGPSEPALSNPTTAWKANVDGDVYASPLVVAGHILVATENNTVYSLDMFTGSVIWKIHLGDPVASTSLPCGDIGPVTGITGTPAVDVAGDRLYVVAFLSTHHHVLFALNLTDGTVALQQDVDPAGSHPIVQQQRGALAIASGHVYVPLGGLYGDCGQYHGYVVAVPLTGGPAAVYQVPSPREAGIWSPMGVTIDPAGNVYAVTGNGAGSSFDYANSLLELSGDLRSVKSFFAPANWFALSVADTDLGALGATVLPQLGLALAVGKDGVAYLVDAARLGGIGGQLTAQSLCAGAFGGTAWAGSTVYVPCADGLYAVSVSNRSLKVLWRTSRARNASPIISAGVVWAIDGPSATLLALDPASGAIVYSVPLGSTMHFSTPAATDGFVIAPAGRSVVAVAVTS